MNHTAFFNAVKSGELLGFYLFEGPEEYIKQQALKRLRERLLPAGLESLNDTELSNPDAGALMAAAETMPFMAEKRVVVVRDLAALTPARGKKDDAKPDTSGDALTDYLGRLPPTVCVVFYVKGKADARRKLYAFAKRKNAIVDFAVMGDGECAQWAAATLRREGKAISPQTAARLVFTVGRDAALLKQEMDKLCAYAGERSDITDGDVDAVCTRSTECTVFQMVDAQVAGQNDRAFSLLSDMLRSGESDFAILAMLLRQYRILYHMRCLLDERAPAQNHAALLGIPPFSVGRTQQQARRFDKARLREAYDYLLDYETRLKQGRASHESCVQTALLRLEGLLRPQPSQNPTP